MNIRELQKINWERSAVKYPQCMRWTHDQWYTAISNENGELGGWLKEINRGNKTVAEVKEEIGKELGDIFTYLTLFASSMDIDLESAIIGKYNEVCDRLGYEKKL